MMHLRAVPIVGRCGSPGLIYTSRFAEALFAPVIPVR